MSTRSLNELDKEKECKNNNNNEENEDDDDDEDDEDYVPDEKTKESDDDGDDDAQPNDQSDIEEQLSGNEHSPSKSKKLKLDEEKNELKTKRTEDLWSNFLSDVKSTSSSTNQIETSKVSQTENSNNKTESSKNQKQFPQMKPKTNPTTVTTKPQAKSGIANILNKINKPKINTLEKSRLDWEEYKKSEHLEDDLNQHSKGKESYLERRAFLDRVDYREYEIEKSLRTKERKLRDSH